MIEFLRRDILKGPAAVAALAVAGVEAQAADQHPIVEFAKKLKADTLRAAAKPLNETTSVVDACTQADAIVHAEKDALKTVLQYVGELYKGSRFSLGLKAKLAVLFTGLWAMKQKNPDKDIPQNFEELLSNAAKHIESDKKIDCAPEKLKPWEVVKGVLQSQTAGVLVEIVGLIAKDTESTDERVREKARAAADAALKLLAKAR
jgi:hypothetical protein